MTRLIVQTFGAKIDGIRSFSDGANAFATLQRGMIDSFGRKVSPDTVRGEHDS